jgi:hypothetical protein
MFLFTEWTAMSFKPEIFVSGSWAQNGLAFATKREAMDKARHLMRAWTMVDSCRVISTDQVVNYRWEDGQLKEARP